MRLQDVEALVDWKLGDVACTKLCLYSEGQVFKEEAVELFCQVWPGDCKAEGKLVTATTILG